MKITTTLCTLIAMLIPVVAQEATPKTLKVEGWGTAENPAEDCLFKTGEGGKLTITVPGSAKAHDLSAELGNTTAPRVLQEVEGDFTIQVKIEGEFAPGGESTQEGRTGYTGAGLVVFADANNFVRIERATLQRIGGPATPYTNFEIRVHGELERIGTTGDLQTEADKPTWLRLERRGTQLLGAMSQDGVNWNYGEPKELFAEPWNRKGLKAGVAAISTSQKPFVPLYSELTLKHQGKPEAPKPEAAQPEPKVEGKSDPK
jgi:regulation of enolase protein 1 (concanavalin A-like superfamily)